jgi:hypothetical protein
MSVNRDIDASTTSSNYLAQRILVKKVSLWE